MIQEYENKKVLAAMRSKLKSAAKTSEREARIMFVLIHLFSAHHELMDAARKPEGEDHQYRFIICCLKVIADEMESENGRLASYRKAPFSLHGLVNSCIPAKDAVDNRLEPWQEWPDEVPYDQWMEDAIRTAYMTMFGLYYWNTPIKDMMRWLGKNEPKNPKFVNAMNANETMVHIEFDRQRSGGVKEKTHKKKMYVSDEEMVQGKEHLDELREVFVEMYGQLAEDDTLRFCQEKEETAFGIFMLGAFAMMVPGDDVNRKAMASDEHCDAVYQAAKQRLMGGKLLKDIVTNDDDKAASEVFHWGLKLGEMGISGGDMPTGLADIDIRRKPGPKAAKPKK